MRGEEASRASSSAGATWKLRWVSVELALVFVGILVGHDYTPFDFDHLLHPVGNPKVPPLV